MSSHARGKLTALCLSTFLFLQHSFADQWLCRSQSSMMEGPDTILVCGVGSAISESRSRSLAREAALGEFNALCARSESCRGRTTSVEPLRQECIRDDTKTTCYRALRINLGKPKTETKLNRVELESELARKRQALEALESQYRELKRLERLTSAKESEVRVLSQRIFKQETKLNEIEAKLDDPSYLWEDSSRTYTIRLGTGYLGLNTDEIPGDFWIFQFGVEWRPLSFLGIEVSGLAGGSVGSEPPNQSMPNSTITELGDGSVSGFATTVRIYGTWQGLVFLGGYQTIKARGDRLTASYGPLGIPSSTTSESVDEDVSAPFVGLGWTSRKDAKGWIWGLGGRYLVGSGSQITVGLGFGF